MTPTLTRSESRLARVIIVLGVVLIATSMRPALTSVGPVLDRIGLDTGLPATGLGLLAAVPLLAFAAISPLVHQVAVRWGIDRTLLFALLLLAVGVGTRSIAGPVWLWAGTMIIGTAIAVINVLLPAVVKRDFPGQVPRMTASYSAVMNGSAAVASGLSVPLADLLPADWRGALVVWSGPALIAAIAWLLRIRVLRHRASAGPGVPVVAPRPVDPERTMWRSALAWQVTLTMGLQSTIFYILVTWLPTIEVDRGLPPALAGLHLLIMQVAGMVAGWTIGSTLSRWRDQRAVGVLLGAGMIIAMIGILVAPAVILLWVIIAGMCSGSSIMLALTVIGLRTRTAAQTTRLSGMAQSVGYLMAAGGPIAGGWLHTVTGDWQAVLILIIVLAAGHGTAGYLAGRNRHTHARVD
ncbi:CynX/NimT family MFS transporter [Microlunatus speluncae]|uniref:CynX/NimT family MFS transporter n=1 Tax=Microlunatus speluncae TaxID=2594267 RepID=UPI00126613A0|nr:MFS transporter [Microlunatus speluncae]